MMRYSEDPEVLDPKKDELQAGNQVQVKQEPKPRVEAVSQSQESKYSVYDPEQSPMIDGNKSKYNPEPRLKIQIIDSEDENVPRDPEVN